MREVIIQMCKFDELNEKQQKKVISEHYDINVSHDWYEDTITNFMTDMETKGFDIPKGKIYSDAPDRGDTSFCATVNLTNFLRAHGTIKSYPRVLNEWKKANLTFKVTQTGSYHHSYSMDVETLSDIESVDGDDVEDFIDSALEGGKDVIDSICELEVWIKEKAREYANNLGKQLQEEYDYLTTDESIKESIIINEMEFEREE